MDNEVKERKKSGFAIFFAFTTLICLAAVVFVCIKYRELDTKISAQIYTQNQADDMMESARQTTRNNTKKVFEEAGTALSALRQLYPDYIVLNYDGTFDFVKIDESIPKNTLDNNNFKKNEKGEMEYYQGDKVISHKGIDVSKYQGDIDWKAVAADGVEFAIIRLGYRGYGTGEIQIDETFEKNIKAASDAGITVGVYFFSQAVTKDEAKEEAKTVIDNIKKYKIKGPVVFDTEEVAGSGGRLEELDKDKLTDVTIEFLETVKKAGYKPMLYANLKWFSVNLDMSRLADYDKWFAAYTAPLYFPYEIKMWQYSDAGSVAGIQGMVDMNISFEKIG